MKIRLSTKKDLIEIMKIIDESKKYFKLNGIPQWQNGVPNEETILNDISNKFSYVLCDDDDIVGTFALCFEDDPNYTDIQQGRWLNNYEYGVIHRIAIKQKYKGFGYASLMFQFAEEKAKKHQVENLRIDTHRLNNSMQRLIAKNNFIYCGLVYVSEIDGERLAYHKVL